EAPENWLRYGNPWEFPRPGVIYPVRFGGSVVEYKDAEGRWRHQWINAEEVMAMAFDVPIPGYGGKTVNNLRLWSARSTREFNLRYFNAGNYIEAVRDKNESENLSKVLYPSDSTARGKELRFKQEYFFVSASLQDILARFRKCHASFDSLPDHVAVQLNDTHPALVVAELMRILVDEHHYDWSRAWTITRRACAYTNHTLLPEALETWPVELFERLLPRHLGIIYAINHDFLNQVRHRYPGDVDVLRRMSLIDESGERRIRMANLAMVGSHKVNGVAAIHTELMKSTIFSDWERFEPGKINCKTNGITPRRWLLNANPGLAGLIDSRIGKGWVNDLDQLRRLEPFAEDAEFQAQFAQVKRGNKLHLTQVIEQRLGIEVEVDSLFDVMVKRMHEYKRQLLNVLHVINRYNRIRANPCADYVPRTVIIGGKAAPGYAMAKLILKLINDVA
ncbi:MAG: glycogen/starch/alpha-glucan family phosphorylase, partial [Rhodospirillales bacterium]|nr:glycogen/starch/alpha-glucan family phosphorylase [Rhodospirillales bacterium]